MRRFGWIGWVGIGLCASAYASPPAALTAATAPASDSDVISDVRCIVVGAAMAGTQDQTAKSSGIMLTLYYIGRLEGRAPNVDLEQLILEQSSAMTKSEFGAEATRCGSHLADKGREITRIGQDLVAREKKPAEASDNPAAPAPSN